MNEFLIITFLFFIGSLTGWVLELFYRRFSKKGRTIKKWINPGFLTGPYLPLYGFSLVSLYLLAHIKIGFIKGEAMQKVCLFIVMAIVVTFIEYIAGLIFIKSMKIKLWDYSNEWGNIKGIICPRFTCYWMILSAIYYFMIHPSILNALHWLAKHLAFSFVIGFFYGVFLVDLCYSMKVMARIRQFAIDYELEVRYEELKHEIAKRNEKYKKKVSFLFAFRFEDITLIEYMEKYMENLSHIKEKMIKNKNM